MQETGEIRVTHLSLTWFSMAACCSYRSLAMRAFCMMPAVASPMDGVSETVAAKVLCRQYFHSEPLAASSTPDPVYPCDDSCAQQASIQAARSRQLCDAYLRRLPYKAAQGSNAQMLPDCAGTC